MFDLAHVRAAKEVWAYDASDALRRIGDKDWTGAGRVAALLLQHILRT